jgi:hypothetical protein
MVSNSFDMQGKELRQSLEQLLETDFSVLHDELNQMQTQIRALESLTDPFPQDIQGLRDSLQNLMEKSQEIEQQIFLLQKNLTEPDQVKELMQLGLTSAFHAEIQKDAPRYSEIIAPVISPAISHQIRNARPEMIAALYPIIGQTISKAISEAMQDLRRRIDANLKRNLNIRQRMYRLTARFRGVSASDLILRESLDYRITHVFLIHRETGLLLKQVSNSEEAQDMDIFSAMLTAIRDFARDTFGSKDEDLEEIQYGAAHILLKNGLYAYLAVVVEGVQPSGFAGLMQQIIHQINLNYGDELRQFSGEMNDLHDFREDLLVLLNPSSHDLEDVFLQETLSSNQKTLLGWSIAGFLLLITLSIFACVFTIRLMPVAFPAPTQTFTPVILPTLTNTPSPTLTLTPTPTQTVTPTLTVSPIPSPTLQKSPTGIMLGNVWVRLNPSATSRFNPVVIVINTPVEILAIYDKWVKISWDTEFGYEEGWVPSIWVSLPKDIPKQIITPSK